MADSINAFILGQAQRSYHEVDAVDHPYVLMCEIVQNALADAGLTAAEVDAVGCVDPFSWTYADLGGKVAKAIGCRDGVREFWRPAGGTTPQDLLHDIANAMADGDVDVAVIFGAEAMRTRRKATRAGQDLDWPPRDKDVKPMRGQQPFSSDWEAKHGLRLPIQSFPMLENAIRAARGRTADEQIRLAAELLHKNARVASTNANAWFQDAPTIETIANVNADNRMISYPYTKRMNAIMDVDQAAALVVVSRRVVEKKASRERAVAILSGAGADEVWNPMQRRELARCVAMEAAFGAALSESGLTAEDIDAFDFYSCFPAPIQFALDALGIEIDDERAFSLTGGLAYAGGPGNNYVTHSIAKAVEHLRAHTGDAVMVTGVGMANTKHAATLLANATNIPADATGKTTYRVATGDEALPIAMNAEGRCRVATYTVEYDRDSQPSNVIYILDTETGARAIANDRDPVRAAEDLLASEPVGRTGYLTWDAEAERQYFALD